MGRAVASESVPRHRKHNGRVPAHIESNGSSIAVIQRREALLGDAAPLARTIRGKHWLAFDERVLDEIASDEWYEAMPEGEPVRVLHSGAIQVVGERDDALARLASKLVPFRNRGQARSRLAPPSEQVKALLRSSR